MQGYDSDRAGALARQLMERVRTLPGVAGAALSTRPVMRGSGMVQTIGVAGRPIAKSDFLNCSTNGISPGYFETMGIRLLAGTDFSASDEGKEKPLKIVVNQAFVRRFFPGVDAVGKLVGTRGPDGNGRAEYQIAGVVSDAKYRSLREPSPPTIYSLAVKNLDYGFILNVRAQGPPEGLINSVRDTLRALDSQVPLVEIHTMKEEVDMSLWQERLLARLSALFSGFAALLAAIGLYGALDFVVKSRTREIGVRVALGASPGRVAWMLSLETVLLVGAGVALGLTAYAASMRWIRQALYGVAPTDPKAIAMALLFVAAVTLLAAAPPIWRAVRIDASTALRYE
jgi:predicted permease